MRPKHIQWGRSLALLAAVLALFAARGHSHDPQVPGVVGKSPERAAAILSRAGYEVARGSTRNAGGPHCAVSRQRPAPESVVARGRPIRLDVDCAFRPY